MSLQQKLDEIKRQAITRIPSEALEVMNRATEDLRNSGILDNVLKPGDTVPDFSLPDIQGEMISPKALLEKGPLVVCFYRGVW